MIRERFDEDGTDFDFYRFRVPRKEFTPQLKALIRKKFRAALGKFFRKYKKGEEEIPKALSVIKQY